MDEQRLEDRTSKKWKPPTPELDETTSIQFDASGRIEAVIDNEGKPELHLSGLLSIGDSALSSRDEKMMWPWNEIPLWLLKTATIIMWLVVGSVLAMLVCTIMRW